MMKLIKMMMVALLLAVGAMAMELDAPGAYRTAGYELNEYCVQLMDKDVYDSNRQYSYKQGDTCYSICFASPTSIRITKGPDDYWVTDFIYIDSKEKDAGTLAKDSSPELGIINFGSLKTRDDAFIDGTYFTCEELYDLFSAIKDGTAKYNGSCLRKCTNGNYFVDLEF